MVSTRQRAAALVGLLHVAGIDTSATRPKPPRLRDLLPDLQRELKQLYAAFGGDERQIAFRPGSWDLALKDGRVLELDEELHFNRYRALTLGTSWSSSLPWRKDYLRHCETHEAICLGAGRWGSRWVSPSTVRMFGTAAVAGDLDASGGAPRWKQRALYDAIKDAAAVQDSGIKLARLSVHDEVAGVCLGTALNGDAVLDPLALVEFTNLRTT